MDETMVEAVGGLVTATLLTLFVLPAVYSWAGGEVGAAGGEVGAAALDLDRA